MTTTQHHHNEISDQSRFDAMEDYRTARLGQTEIFDTGFIRYDTKMHSGEGTCIRQNSEKILELWTKMPKLQAHLYLWIIQVASAHYKKPLSHCILLNKKTNTLIDVSNGVTKIVSLDEWRMGNIVLPTSGKLTYDLFLETSGRYPDVSKLDVMDDMVRQIFGML